MFTPPCLSRRGFCSNREAYGKQGIKTHTCGENRGIVLEFCEARAKKGSVCFAKFFGHRSKTTHRVVLSLRSIPLTKFQQNNKKAYLRMPFYCFGGTGVAMSEHPSFPSVFSSFSPSKASSISLSGMLSTLIGFLLALIINVKWSSYK